MIDVHCHLLPGIDDGAHDEAMMVAMARASVASGVEAVLCTPHHLNGVYHNERGAILAAVARAQAVLEAEGVPLHLYAGSELHLVPELPTELAAGRALTVNDGGRYALLELPKHTVPVGAETVLERVRALGLVPVIVHPERNSGLRRRPELASRWVEAGCCLQLTGQSVTGEFGAAVQAAADHWLARGEVHLVASDAHRPAGRSPRLDGAFASISDRFGETAARLLLVDNPRWLLEGNEMARALPVRPRGSGFFARLAGKRASVGASPNGLRKFE